MSDVQKKEQTKKPQKKRKNPFEYLVYDFVRLTGAPMGYVIFRPKIIYESEQAKQKIKGGALLVANHTNYFDPMYLLIAIWYRRQHYISKDEFFKKPLRAWLFKQFHCIPIDRENFNINTFREITDQLKSGKLVCMFPEGHVTGTPITDFKAGMTLMALQSGVPIIPVYMKPPKNIFHRLKIVIGDPIYAVDKDGKRLSMMQLTKLTQTLHEKEEQLALLVPENQKELKKQQEAAQAEQEQSEQENQIEQEQAS